jgi:hypothetical protein
LHGVTSVVNSASNGVAWEEMGETFGVLRESWFGVQCRGSFGWWFLAWKGVQLNHSCLGGERPNKSLLSYLIIAL